MRILVNDASTLLTCAVCGSTLSDSFKVPSRQMAEVTCPVCGTYRITYEARRAIEAAPDFARERHRLAGALRLASDQGRVLEVLGANYRELAEAAPDRAPLLEVLDALLQYIGRRTDRFGDRARVDWHDYSQFFLHDADELAYLCTQLKELGFAKLLAGTIVPGTNITGFPVLVELTGAGWRRLDELRRTAVRSHQAFVAMWFDPGMTAAWAEGIQPALAATGFTPVRVDRVEHNEKIDDRIVAEIRRSGLLVADFTGQRGGVYFEAGFAQGLGLPVVWTCRLDEIGKVHFDTRQYNHVTWETPGELRDKLVARIRATIPGARLTDE